MLKPVLIGENNPQFGDAEHALWPEPPNGTGANILKMLREHLPDLTQREYVLGFDRRNILDSKTWNDRAAREAAAPLWSELGGRRIVLLGSKVFHSIHGKDTTPPQPIDWVTDFEDRTWCLLPHPSVKNLWYNDPINRAAAEMLLAELYLMGRSDGNG
jgi:hypothetical protein